MKWGWIASKMQFPWFPGKPHWQDLLYLTWFRPVTRWTVFSWGCCWKYECPLFIITATWSNELGQMTSWSKQKEKLEKEMPLWDLESISVFLGNYKVTCMCSIVWNPRNGMYRAVYMLRRDPRPTPVLLPRKLHGWKSLVGCSPWGPKESDMTEWLHFHFFQDCPNLSLLVDFQALWRQKMKAKME